MSAFDALHIETLKEAVEVRDTLIATLRAENARLSDQVYELQQAPWPKWAQDILDILHQRGIVTQFDDEVNLPDAVADLLNGDDLAAQETRLRADLAAVTAQRDGFKVDAERWRALLGSARLRPLGWAGFDADSPGHAEGYRHFGMEFWTQHDAPKSDRGAKLLTDYADAARSALQPGQEAKE